jgi:alcohol dehydrogenase class IV
MKTRLIFLILKPAKESAPYNFMQEENMFKGRIPQFEFGEGILANVGKIAVKYGDKAILVMDPFLDSGETGKKIIRRLNDEGINAVKFTEIEPNPSCFTIDKAGRIARDNGVQSVIAAGGGSAIDFGKAVAVISVNDGSSWDYTERADHEIRRPKTTLPIIAIPTTSGTGSETTPFSVLNNTSIKEKSTIVSDHIYASAALIDPELTYTMPRRLTASTGFDAFAHCLESYISLAASPFSRMVAREGMRIVTEYLPQAVANGGNREARAKMAWASAMGGSAISAIGVTLPHSLGQPVGGFRGAPHGESVAACMVEVLKISYMSDPQAFADITDILDPSYASASVRKRAAACPELVQDLLDTIELRVRFSDFGLDAQDIDRVTSIALTGYYFDIKCHPRAVGEEDIKALYSRCL